MSDATTIATMLDDLLAAAVDAFSVPDAPDPPARQVIVHGDAVWDCEQLSVACTQVIPALPASGLADTQRCAVVPQARFVVEILRDCQPTVDANMPMSAKLPAAAALTAAALALSEDAAVLWLGIATAAIDGSLFPSVPTIGCKSVRLEPMVATGPLGAFAGWRLPFTVTFG